MEMSNKLKTGVIRQRSTHGSFEGVWNLGEQERSVVVMECWSNGLPKLAIEVMVALKFSPLGYLPYQGTPTLLFLDFCEIPSY